MENKKPVTENQKIVARQIYEILKNSTKSISKEEICEKLGWQFNSSTDRKIRDTINLIKKSRPIVATPDQKGYYLCKNKNDLEQCVHQWKYIDSIIEDLELTKKPLIAFYEYFTGSKHDK